MRKNNPLIHLTIHDIGSNGEGIGRLPEDGYTVFVDGALPGEEVEAELYQRHKNYGRARLKHIVSPSPHRATPPCPLFQQCGGCQLMHLSYEKQLEKKTERVSSALERIGKFTNLSVSPCLASPSPLHYRNKIQLPVREENGKIRIGLYALHSNDLIDVDNCLIHCSLGESIYKKVKHIIQNSPIRAYNPRTGKGELRHILIKSAVHTGHSLVILVSNQPVSPEINAIAKEIRKQCPAVSGVIHNLNIESGNVILGRRYTTLEGADRIQETLCGLTFSISPASFFQVNADQAEQLYRQALTFANLSGKECVLDAYCGVGTLSLIFSQQAKRVIGVECVPEAIEDAKKNAAHNGITNASFYCDAAEEYIQKLEKETIDVILLNPPRKGCELSFLEGINRLKPKKVIYISCDPATLARDLGHLRTFGYHVEAVQPFDMFPQTAHVECVVSLTI